MLGVLEKRLRELRGRRCHRWERYIHAERMHMGELGMVGFLGERDHVILLALLVAKLD